MVFAVVNVGGDVQTKRQIPARVLARFVTVDVHGGELIHRTEMQEYAVGDKIGLQVNGFFVNQRVVFVDLTLHTGKAAFGYKRHHDGSLVGDLVTVFDGEIPRTV